MIFRRIAFCLQQLGGQYHSYILQVSTIATPSNKSLSVIREEEKKIQQAFLY